MNRKFGIEILRFALSLAVVAYHYLYFGPQEGKVIYASLTGHWFVFGPVAVLAFFVVSGYVISISVLGKDWQAFLAARFARLFPALLACSTLTFMALKILGNWPQYDLGVYLKSVTFFPILLGGELIDDSYWSLVVELRFYLLVTVLAAARQFRWLPEIVVVLTLLGWGLVLADPAMTWVAEFLIYEYGGFFVLGCLLFRVTTSGLSLWTVVLGLVGMGAATFGSQVALVAMNAQLGETASLSTFFLLTAISLCAVVVAERTEIPPALQPVARTLGAMSYPLYLVHQLAGYVVLDTLVPVIGLTGALLLTLSLVLGVSWAVSRWVEGALARPLRSTVERGLRAISLSQKRASNDRT